MARAELDARSARPAQRRRTGASADNQARLRPRPVSRAVYRRRRLVLVVATALLGLLIVVPLKLSGGGSIPKNRTEVSPRPLAVAATLPGDDRTLVPGSHALAIRFTVPLRSGSRAPTISPTLAGHWTRPNPTTLAFLPAHPFAAGQVLTVTIPGGPTGITAMSGRRLPGAVVERFEVEDPGVEQVENALARLSYLPLRPLAPVSWHLREPNGTALTVVGGPGFAWTWPAVPTALASLWAPGEPNVMVKGAEMAFEHARGLSSSTSQAQLLATLRAAVAEHATAPHPYAYVLVSETLPETLTLWQGGRRVLTSLANTGEVGAATPVGTWPIYSRYRVQTMSGVEPDGTSYTYPNVPWVSYFTGDIAIHEFNRTSYGYPQSVGCVELPSRPAATVWSAVFYGSLVTVQGPSAPKLSLPSTARPGEPGALSRAATS